MTDQTISLIEAVSKHKNMGELLNYQKALKSHGFKYYHNEVSGDNWFKRKGDKSVAVNVNTLKWKHDGAEGDSIDSLHTHLRSQKNESTDQTIRLIDAIASGDTITSSQMFNDALMSRISDMIDTRRQNVAENMFESELNESIINEAVNVEPKLNSDDRKALSSYIQTLKRSRPTYVKPGMSFEFRGSKVTFS